MSMKPLILRCHRWISLIFAIPLAVVIVTGLLLSLPPVLQASNIKPGSLTLQKLEALMDQHDPLGAARSLRFDTFQNVLTIDNTGIDPNTGLKAQEAHWLSELTGKARGVHRRLNGDLGWLVIASTIAMLIVIALGVFMGLPRLSNSLSGWHKVTAWVLLPLIILSPLTGLFMAAGVTFSQPAPRLQAQAPSLRESVRLIAASHDLSGLEWIRDRGGRMMARINGVAGQDTYIVTREGLTPAPSNWPRTFHEGAFLGLWSGVMNVILSIAFALLLGSGLIIWARRALRPRRRARTISVAQA